MRAMIVAAGLGTRLRPLTELRPKPALPVRGLPLLAYNLALLAKHGVREVVINTHVLPERLKEAARRFCPAEIALEFSVEEELLDTGGGIRRVADFLSAGGASGSEPCLILGGDMILDADLSALIEKHRSADAAVTLLLRADPRTAKFGSIGIDAEGRIRRIGRRFDLGGETGAGLYTWANVLSPRAFESLPDREVFSHLDDWLAPLLAQGAEDIRAELWDTAACFWEPVGTPAEYLAANLARPNLSFLDVDALARAHGTRFEGDLVLGAGATLGAGASLRRAVVWEGEQVPAGLEVSGGVFAGGAFHGCGREDEVGV